jgi:hypothetical protein
MIGDMSISTMSARAQSNARFKMPTGPNCRSMHTTFVNGPAEGRFCVLPVFNQHAITVLRPNLNLFKRAVTTEAQVKAAAREEIISASHCL